jgi:hypothetical protein
VRAGSVITIADRLSSRLISLSGENTSSMRLASLALAMSVTS